MVGMMGRPGTLGQMLVEVAVAVGRLLRGLPLVVGVVDMRGFTMTANIISAQVHSMPKEPSSDATALLRLRDREEGSRIIV